MKNVDITQYLNTGEAHATTTRDLATLLDVNPRDITHAVHLARCSGEVICSTENGFFLPETREDVANFCRIMASRRRKIAKASQSAKKFLKGEGAG